jgi:ribose 1,5-bisphosphokinase PhnN
LSIYIFAPEIDRFLPPGKKNIIRCYRAVIPLARFAWRSLAVRVLLVHPYTIQTKQAHANAIAQSKHLFRR